MGIPARRRGGSGYTAAMAEVVLFHSAYGLRPAVRAAAARLRALGHRVETPDLYDGRVAETLEQALAVRDAIGRDALLERARAALEGVRPGAVLAGFSLGASLAQRIAATDIRFDRLLLLHGVAEPPQALPLRWTVQAHVAEGDPWAPPEELRLWRAALARLGASVDLHLYPADGHLFTDAGLPDFDPWCAEAAWRRAEAFLEPARRSDGG